ncbi:MAG: biotin/lipoyl-binding protein [Pirellulaceae bacterium]
MFRHAVPVILVVAVLGGLIYYSQHRPMVDRVSGFIEADEIRVGSRLGGRIAKMHVQEGAPVKTGDRLVELEPYDLLQREQEAAQSLAVAEARYDRVVAGLRPEEIAQARARMNQAKARVDLLRAGPRDQEIRAAEGRLQLAESELSLAQQNYNRNKKLLSENAISQAEFDPRLREKSDGIAVGGLVRRKTFQ